MNDSVLVLVLYAAWTLLLLAGIVTLRTGLVFGGKRAANTFAPAGDDVSPFSARLCRAHANCVENLPIAAAVILGAVASGHADITGGALAWVLLGARVAQSSIHIASTSPAMVIMRANMLAAQIGILAFWIVRLVGALA
jgi:uncharacterized MAPEG superfamily protein